MQFNLPKDQSSIIKVIGVGGGGSNAVNHMYKQGIKGVDFVVCNTDSQALDVSPVPVKIQLGSSLTEGRGAGSLPDVGKNAAIENINEIQDILAKNTKMVFVTAGMGGGTGTGAAPVIARAARELDILTVGIVTVPFGFEGRKRRQQAEAGIEEMREAVDTLLIINNDRLREMFGNLSLGNAFAEADNVLTTAAKGIAELISVTGQINVDFNDVSTVMKDSGVAIMGSAAAEGENRAIKAVEKALASPLLNDNQIEGAKYVLLNITYGDQEVLMDEISDITDYIQDEAGSSADVIWGHAYDESLGNNISVTLIATGFKATPDTGITQREPAKRRMNLIEDKTAEVTTPIQSPIANPVSETTNTWSAPVVAEEVSEDITSSSVEEVEDEMAEPFLKTVEPTMETTEEVQPELTFESNTEIENSTEDTISEIDEENKVVYNLEDDVVEPTNTVSEEPVKRFMLDDEVISDEVESEMPSNSWEATPSASTEEVSEGPSFDFTNRKPVSEEPSNEINKEDVAMKSEERISRIKELCQKLKTPSGLSELENEPAYKRKNVNLEDQPHSSESNVSRFSINDIEDEETGERKWNLRDNNSFLHDNVD